MSWIQLIFASVLLLIGGVFIAFNAMVYWFTVIRKEEMSSAAPIVGGLIAAAGVATLPLASSWHWAWVPLVLDWGGIPGFLYHWLQQRADS